MINDHLPLANGGEMHERMQHVLLVEDHSSFRQALAMVIDREPEFSVVAQAGSLAEARRILSAVERIDLAVIDLSLPDGDGIEAVRALHDAHPRAMALILTASIDPTDHARAVEAGAAGVLHKAVSITAIVGALHRLGAGEWLLSQREVVELLRVATHRREQTREAQATLAQLTSRERDVLDALAEGLSSKGIAEKLFITVETERTHMVNVLSKLGVHSRLEALVFAVRHDAVHIR